MLLFKQMEISDLLPLKPQEIDLIHLIRTQYRFGKIEIITRDGVPVDIEKTICRVRLSTTFIDLT